MKENKAILGEKITEIRKNKGLSQNALAKLAGISQSGLSAVEHGHSSPSFEMLEKILKALEIPISEFISLVTENMSPSEGQIVVNYKVGSFVIQRGDDFDDSIKKMKFPARYFNDKTYEKRITEMFTLFNSLNESGQIKSLSYAEGLLESPEYSLRQEKK